MHNSQQHHSIVFFDGHCLFCQTSVQWLLKKDKNKNLLFASLQGKKAQELRNQQVWPDSIVFFTDGKIYFESSAALKISAKLPFPFPLAIVFFIVPSFIRNALYRYIAANRYKWFGKSEACYLPNEEERARFID